MRPSRPATAVSTFCAVETSLSSGLYPPGLNRVAIPPKAQIPTEVFIAVSCLHFEGAFQIESVLRRPGTPPAQGLPCPSSSPRPGELLARQRVDRDRDEQDRAGRELLDSRRVADEAHSVGKRGDDESAVERVLGMAPSAEEARAADDGG